MLAFMVSVEGWRVSPGVVSWQRRTKSSAKQRNMEIA